MAFSICFLHIWTPSLFFHALAELLVGELKYSWVLLLNWKQDLVPEHEQLWLSRSNLKGTRSQNYLGLKKYFTLLQIKEQELTGDLWYSRVLTEQDALGIILFLVENHLFLVRFFNSRLNWLRNRWGWRHFKRRNLKELKLGVSFSFKANTVPFYCVPCLSSASMIPAYPLLAMRVPFLGFWHFHQRNWSFILH